MTILVDTSAVEGIGWSVVFDRYPLEKSYLPIFYTSLSTPCKGIAEAAKNGHMDLVEYFVSQGAKGANDWSERSSYECAGNVRGGERSTHGHCSVRYFPRDDGCRATEKA